METTPASTRKAPYHPRLKRTAEGRKRKLRLHLEAPNDRHLHIFKWIYWCPFMAAEELLALFPPDPQRIAPGKKPSGRYLETLLQTMWLHGYLTRRELPDGRLVYGLGNKGAEILTTYGYMDRKRVDWDKKIKGVTTSHIEHTRLLSRFRRAMTLALDAREDVALGYWKSDGEFKEEVRVQEHDKETRIPVIPDALVQLASGEYKLHTFAEGDRSTMAHADYVQKLRGYYHFYIQKLHEQYGMAGFAVLTITKTRERAENLRKAALAVSTEARYLRLFWFTDERAYADDPHRIFEPIWQTPVDEEPRSLLGQRRVVPGG